MPLFVIEREFADQLDMNHDLAREIVRVNDEVGIEWISSFLSADRKKTYCLYEAPTAETISEAARRLHFPADVIVEVSRIKPDLLV